MSKINLRALTSVDIEKTIQWHNQSDISDLYSGHPFPVNIEMERKWYEKILISNFPTTVFGIELIESKKLIGITVLRNINLINRVAEFAMYVGDKNERGKGYGKEAVLQTIEFGFFKLGLNRIFIKVLEDNITTKKLHESIGFSVEGILRMSVYKNNSYRNEFILGILKDEFIKKNTEKK